MSTASNREHPTGLVLTTEEVDLLRLWHQLPASAHAHFTQAMQEIVSAIGRASSPDQSPGTPDAPPGAWRDTS
jgi:hypothetical protein